MLDNNVNTYVMKPITVNAILVSKDNIDSVIKFLGDSFVSVDQNNDCILFNQFGLKGVLTNAEYYLVNSSNVFHVCRADTFISIYEVVQ